MRIARKHSLAFLAALLCLPLVLSSGCVLSQLLYVLHGHKAKAPFPGLVGKKVAIVCVTDAEAYGPDTLTYTISKAVGLKLANGVKKISVVPPAKIENWLDNNDWNQVDFAKLGKGVGAEMVVAIDISRYTIHEGATLYKGRSNLKATVYDVTKNGEVLYEFGPAEYSFPTNGRPAIQTNDRNFEAVYLAKLTEHISNLFCDHDALDQVAEDASLLSY